MKSSYYKITKSGIECRLCPHNCIIKNKSVGVCGVRYNDGNNLISKNYGKISALNLLFGMISFKIKLHLII